MSSDTSHIQFSRHIWQAVNEQARRCLLSREFCPEQSKIDNLRCVHFEEEIESCYGRQLWYFEAMGVDPIGRRHKLFGALEFSVQYGLLEACQAALFDDSDHRQRFLNAATQPIRSRIWDHSATRFWVRMAVAGVVVLSAMWIMTVVLKVTGLSPSPIETVMNASELNSPVEASPESLGPDVPSADASTADLASADLPPSADVTPITPPVVEMEESESPDYLK